MNVAIFTDNDFDKVNGVTTSLRAALRHAPEDVHARVYTANRVGIKTSDYLAVESMGVGIPFYGEMKMYWPRLQRFSKQAVQDGIDLIHLTTPGPVGLSALFVAWRTGLPMVGSFHTDLATYTRILSGSPCLGALMREYLRWPYGRCRRVLVPSQATRDMLVEAKFNPAKLTMWRCGVDTEMFSPAKRSMTLRERWGLSRRRPGIIYVGRVSREKGLGLLPALEATLRRWQPDHRLIIVGDGPMRHELQSACPDAVFTGTLSRAEVAVALASADLLVFPSETDAAGSVVLEAQASGLSVVVTDRGGPREYMVEEQTGIVCRTPEEFLIRVAALTTDEDRRQKMGCAAREYALGLRWEAALAPLYERVSGRRFRTVPASRDRPCHGPWRGAPLSAQSWHLPALCGCPARVHSPPDACRYVEFTEMTKSAGQDT